MPPDIWPDSTVHTGEVAKLLGVDVRTIKRLRARGLGPVRIPAGTYYGRTIWYMVWELIVWSNKLIGERPTDYDTVWAWWIETRTDLEGPRLEPVRKPPGTPKDEQQGETNRWLRKNLILRLAQADDQHAQRLFEGVR